MRTYLGDNGYIQTPLFHIKVSKNASKEKPSLNYLQSRTSLLTNPNINNDQLTPNNIRPIENSINRPRSCWKTSRIEVIKTYKPEILNEFNRSQQCRTAISRSKNIQ